MAALFIAGGTVAGAMYVRGHAHGEEGTVSSSASGEDSELSEASRAYLRELMGGIAVDQDWGVSAAGSAFGLKNGWLPRSTTGLRDINSIGRVTVDGRDYLVAVLSNGNTTKATGISLVEAAAKAAVSVFAEPI